MLEEQRELRSMRTVLRIHAIQRMFERGISIEDVAAVLASGETIEAYPDDSPYPSRLILGWRGKRPLHLVVADDPDAEERIIVTVYEPDPAQWEAGFKRRKK
jgi:hypothetical protein